MDKEGWKLMQVQNGEKAEREMYGAIKDPPVLLKKEGKFS